MNAEKTLQIFEAKIQHLNENRLYLPCDIIEMLEKAREQAKGE